MVTLDEVKQNLKRITDTFYYTKSEVLNKLDEKANTNHTHNQYLTQHQSLANYYTKSEVDSALNNVDLSNYYSKSEIDTLISNIDLSDYYDKTEVDALIEAIDLSGFATISELDTKVTLIQVLQLLIDYGLVRTADTVNSVILAGDKSVLSYVDGDVLTLSATVYDENNAVVPNKRVVFYKDDTVLDTVYTDANGVATYEYHSAGVGDISFEASVGSLLSETYGVTDAWKYDSNSYNSNITVNINLPSDFRIEFDVNSNSSTSSNTAYIRADNGEIIGNTSNGDRKINLYDGTNHFLSSELPVSSDITLKWECIDGVQTLTDDISSVSVNKANPTSINLIGATINGTIKNIIVYKL